MRTEFITEKIGMINYSDLKEDCCPSLQVLQALELQYFQNLNKRNTSSQPYYQKI